MFTRGKFSLLAMLAFATVPMTAAKATVTYDYVGHNYDYVQDTDFVPDLTGSITFGNLSSNYTGVAALSSLDVTNFEFTSGQFSMSTTSGFLAPAIFDYGTPPGPANFIFQNGNIIGWLLYGYDTGPHNADFYSVGGNELADDPGLTYDDIEGVLGTDITFSQGVWTKVSHVPLPSGICMFGSAFVGLIGFGIRKSRRTINA